MTLLDYIVRAPELVGTRVRIENASVFAADPATAFLRTGANSFTRLRSPWAERADLRSLLANCTSIIPDQGCRMVVVGTVTNDMTQNVNELTDVDFEVPTN